MAVVDTDVVSFIFRNDTRAALYGPHLAGRVLTISFMTLAELDQWALERNWGVTRRQRLAEHLADYMVHPYDRDLCRWWATVRVACRRLGRPIEVADAWIAATALLYDIPRGVREAIRYRRALQAASKPGSGTRSGVGVRSEPGS
jgi:tRNA(fMet)-specific endonuclease VapC